MKGHDRTVYETHGEGEAALARGDYEAAQAAFEYVRAALGDSGRYAIGAITLPHVLNNLLACAQPAGDWQAMKDVATELTVLEPGDADAWIRRSIGQKHLGELAAATASVMRAIAIDPDDGNAYYEHACQLAVAGDHDAALDRCADAIANGARKGEMMADDELASLRDLPRWRQLMKR